MASNGKVNPDCGYASNPYHECTDACLKKIAEGKGRSNKKKSGNGYISTKRHNEKVGHRSCPKASNPYHECNDHCFKSGAAPGAAHAVKPGGKTMRESYSLPPRDLENVPRNAAYNSSISMPPTRLHTPEKIESENGHRYYSSDTYSGEIQVEDPSPNETQLTSFPLVPVSGILSTPDSSKRGKSSPSGSVNFSFSALGASDDDETQSVVSDSSVSVGKYRVKRRLSPILQSISNKYGDIAADCHLESIAMRSYYLECVCFVVQELQITQIRNLTDSKTKEMLAILKDVEASGINVAWLRRVIGENSDAMELINQHREVEEAREKCKQDMESAKKKLEAQMESLSLKEKELDDAKRTIADTRAHLRELELKSSVFSETVTMIQSKFEALNGKTLLDKVL